MPVSKVLCTDLQTNFMMCISFLPVVCCWLCVGFFHSCWIFVSHSRLYMCMHTESLIQSLCSSYYHVYVKIHGGHMWLCPGYAENALMHTFKMPSNKESFYILLSLSLARILSENLDRWKGRKIQPNMTHQQQQRQQQHQLAPLKQQSSKHIMAGTKW